MKALGTLPEEAIILLDHVLQHFDYVELSEPFLHGSRCQINTSPEISSSIAPTWTISFKYSDYDQNQPVRYRWLEWCDDHWRAVQSLNNGDGWTVVYEGPKYVKSTVG